MIEEYFRLGRISRSINSNSLSVSKKSALVREGKMDNIIFHHLENIGAIEITVIGKYPNNNQDIYNIWESLHEFRSEHGAQKIVLDYRRVESMNPFLIAKNLTDRIQKYDLNDEKISVAIVTNKSSSFFYKFQMVIEGINAKRFHGSINTRYRLFESYQDATHWLSEIPYI